MRKPLKTLVRLEGFEPPTLGLGRGSGPFAETLVTAETPGNRGV